METPANALGEIHTESKSAQMILYERYINHRYLYMNPAHLCTTGEHWLCVTDH